MTKPVGDKGGVPPSFPKEGVNEKSKIKSISPSTSPLTRVLNSVFEKAKKALGSEHGVGKGDVLKDRKVVEGPIIKGPIAERISEHHDISADTELQNLIAGMEQIFIVNGLRFEKRPFSGVDEVLKGFGRVEDGNGYILSNQKIESYDQFTAKQFTASGPPEKMSCFCSMHPDEGEVQVWMRRRGVEAFHDFVKGEEFISLMKEKNVTNVVVNCIDDDVWEKEIEPVIIERIAETGKNLSKTEEKNVTVEAPLEEKASQRPQMHHEHKRAHGASETMQRREDKKEDIQEHQRKDEEKVYQKEHERLRDQKMVDSEDEKRRVSQQKHEKHRNTERKKT